jgi:hypothetical protein
LRSQILWHVECYKQWAYVMGYEGV